jgi:TM2 domain-containing membrane protein YozV
MDTQSIAISDKKILPALLLMLFFDMFGIHRFYVGKVGTGIAMIFTLGGLEIWVLIDLIMIIIGSFKDKQGWPLKEWT